MRASRLLLVAALIPSILAAWILHETVFSDLDRSASIAVVVGCALTPVSVSWIVDTNFLIATERYLPVALLRVVPPLVLVTAIGATSLIGATSVATVVSSWVAGSVANCALGFRLTGVSLTGARDPFGPLLRAGSRYFGSSAAEASSYRLDQVLALPIIGSVQTGYYSVAGTIATLPVAFAQVLGASYFREVASADEPSLPGLSRRAIQAGSTAGLATAMALACVTPWLVPIVFGPDFRPSVVPSLMALVGAWAVVAAYVASMVLAAEGRGMHMTLSQVTSLTIAVVALVLLGPLWGARGAATAAAIGSWALVALQLHYLQLTALALVPTPAAFQDVVRRLAW